MTKCHENYRGFLIAHKNFCPNIYRRYVDDIFVTFNSNEQLKKFVEYMNAKHPIIKFTFEHEHNNTFSFLDVKTCHEKNKVTTSVYRKPTFSGVFTNFKIFIPTVYKFGLVYTVLHHCFNITSSYEKFHKCSNLKDILFSLLIGRCFFKLHEIVKSKIFKFTFYRITPSI